MQKLVLSCSILRGNIFKCPLREAFKSFHPVGILMYTINIYVLAAFRLSLKKIGNETFSFFIYCRYDIFMFFLKFVKIMNFFVKRGKESNIEHIVFCHKKECT